MKRIGRAGRGEKVHIVDTATRQEGDVVMWISCGSQQFNGSGHGQLWHVKDFDMTKVTCSKCLNKLRSN